jgi:hypothetical protein
MGTTSVSEHALDLRRADSRLDSSNAAHLLERQWRQLPTFSLCERTRALLGSNRCRQGVKGTLALRDEQRVDEDHAREVIRNRRSRTLDYQSAVAVAH